jgi:hypothetical protein
LQLLLTAAELSGRKHRDRHGPRGAKMREALRFLCPSATD